VKIKFVKHIIAVPNLLAFLGLRNACDLPNLLIRKLEVTEKLACQSLGNEREYFAKFVLIVAKVLDSCGKSRLSKTP
jgi:hypothetical protein